MTDFEMTKVCAEAMGLEVYEVSRNPPEHTLRLCNASVLQAPYWPLTNDAQCMALVKRFPAQCMRAMNGWYYDQLPDTDLNRAIVGCVAERHVTEPA